MSPVDFRSDLSPYAEPLKRLRQNVAFSSPENLSNLLQPLDPVLYLDVSQDYGILEQQGSNSDTLLAPQSKHQIQSVPLRSMRDVEFRLQQSKIRLRARKDDQIAVKETPILASYLDIGVLSIKTGVESFLPPTYRKIVINDRSLAPPINSRWQAYQQQQSSFLPHNPTMTNSLSDEELDENDTSDITSPSGDWIDPVVGIALARQVNKEVHSQRIIYNLIYCIGFKFLNSMIRWLDYFYRNHKLPFQNPFYPEIPASEPNIYVGWVIKSVYVILYFNIIVSVYKLFRKQDQCVDLPLSSKQRELLGLDLMGIIDNEDEQTDFIARKRTFDEKHSVAAKIKYTSNASRPIARTTTITMPLPIDLTYGVTPTQRPLVSLGSKKYDEEEVRQLNEKFKKNYSIDFSLS